MIEIAYNNPRPPLPEFEIVLPAGMHDAIREFLFRDSSREYMGVILAGVNETERKVKLLGREFIPVPTEEYERQSAGGLAVRRDFSKRLLRQCAEEGLSQIDVHSHPFGPSPHLYFSGTDDAHERRMARYVYERLEGSLYASLVMNEGYSRARIWLPQPEGVVDHEISTLVLAESPFRRVSIGPLRTDDFHVLSESDKRIFDRQVLAFGEKGQIALSRIAVGVIGAGGLGSAMIEGLSRLGVRNMAIIDPDKAEPSNVNRVSGMIFDDGLNGIAKVEIAARNVRSISPSARPTAIQTSVFAQESVKLLKTCDIIVVATDNHATRMFAQQIGAQYVIPIVSVGVNIEVGEDASLLDISAEFAIALPGEAGWCLACARVYDPERAAIELADATEQQRWIQRGYIDGADVKAPSVGHLNGVIANLALAEIHNLIAPFKKFIGYQTYNLLGGELVPYTIVRNPNCAICSCSGLLGQGDLEPVPDLERSAGGKFDISLVPKPEIEDVEGSNDHRQFCSGLPPDTD